MSSTPKSVLLRFLNFKLSDHKINYTLNRVFRRKSHEKERAGVFREEWCFLDSVRVFSCFFFFFFFTSPSDCESTRQWIRIECACFTECQTDAAAVDWLFQECGPMWSWCWIIITRNPKTVLRNNKIVEILGCISE